MLNEPRPLRKRDGGVLNTIIMQKTITRKIFRAFSKGLSVQVVMGNNTRLLTFLHASKTSGENAYLIVDDPDLQKALENSPAYGKEYFLERQLNYVKEVRDIPQPIVETKHVQADGSVTDAASASTEAGPAEERPMSPEEGITNAAAAKAYLLDKFENDKQNIVNLKRADEVRAYATEKGIVFPNWE